MPSQRCFSWRPAMLPWIMVLSGCAPLAPSVTAQDTAKDRGVRPLSAETVGASVWRGHKDYALLFATNHYDDPNFPSLANPIPDAEAIAKELEETYGFRTEIVKDSRRDAVLHKLSEYGRKEYAEGDQLFIFFAGHGIYDEHLHEGFIVARDSVENDTDRLSYLSYAELRSRVDGLPAKHILLVLDACFSGTIDFRVGQGGSRGVDLYGALPVSEQFQRKAGFPTRKFLTSGRKETVSDGFAGRNSPFAHNVLDALRNEGTKPGYLTFARLLADVEATQPAPHWGEWGSDAAGSDFFFVSDWLSAKLSGADSEPRPPEALPDTRRSIAVLGFQNLSGRPEDARYSAILSTWLTSELEAGEKMRAAPGEDVDRVRKDLALSDSVEYGKNTLASIYKALGAELVVSGSYFGRSDGAIRVDLRIQSSLTGQIVVGTAENGTMADLPGLVTRLGSRVRGKLGIPAPTGDDEMSVKTALPSGTEAARLYADGLVKLRAFDLLAARDELRQAVKADPASALAHQALAKAWEELGYDSEAIKECGKAHELARKLSLRDRSRIDGYYSKLKGEWDQAIQTYSFLWREYPDEPGYAIELASVQTLADKPQDALATLDDLRRKSTQAAGDPQVDLQEAEAARVAQDYKRQAKAADIALRNASANASKLFIAEAYYESCAALIRLGDPKGAETACERARQSSDLGAGQRIKADSLTLLASIMTDQGKGSEAMELRQEALSISRQIGCRKNIAAALKNLALLEASQNQLQDADRNLAEAASIAGEIGDKEQLLSLQIGRGSGLFTLGEYDSAKEVFETALNAARDTNNRREVAYTSQWLGFILYYLGNLAEADRNLRRAIDIAQHSDFQDIRADSGSDLGDVLLARGDKAGARRQYQDALELSVKREEQSSVASSRLSLASLSLEEGNPREAESLARQAAEEFQKEKDVDSEASARDTLARALLAQGKLQDAEAEIGSAISLAPEERTVRMSLAVTAAMDKSRAGKTAEAKESLDNSLLEAKRMKLLGFQLEIRLAQAEIEATSDRGAARLHLQSLERDASESEFLLIAAKAKRVAGTLDK